MTKLVAVLRSDEYFFERRQLPVQCDDTLSLIIQFDDACVGCTTESLKRKELERFVHKFHALSSDELAVALMVTSKDILAVLQQMVPCVGCRRSVERLLKQLQNSGHPALEPLIITATGGVSIKRDFLLDPKAVFALFYIHGSKMAEVMESIPKSKKNKRCNLHSLDTHTQKTKTLGIWEDAWTLLSPECREEVVLIEFAALMKTLENYLRKHRFCTECKSKVLRAYEILIGEVEAKNEKGYVATLFDGLRCCAQEKHIHVRSTTEYMTLLITKAEPELTGSRRERHAKTLDIAQEEVLTCLGIHLYERLYKIHQNVRAEEQTWQILLFLGMDALRKNFDVALETKQGRSNLELVCEELLQEEQAKEQKRELKRQKKKKKKNTTKCPSPTLKHESPVTSEKDCTCDENTNMRSRSCNSCDVDHSAATLHSRCAFQSCSPQHNRNIGPVRDCTDSSRQAGSCLSNGCGDSSPPQHRTAPHCHSAPVSPSKTLPSPTTCNHSDVGYSSGHEGSCSSSSRDGSDVACQEGICNHDGDSVLCDKADILWPCRSCDAEKQQSPKRKLPTRQCDTKCEARTCKSHQNCGLKFGLEYMLEETCYSGEESISEEEIKQFQANQKSVRDQRDQLREVLRQRFANMQTRLSCMCPRSDHSNCD